jgi:SAM-dependent methyltransferase
MGHSMDNSMEKAAFYPQAGVAVTCRSFSEYEAMFSLEEDLLSRGPILDVAGGASSFTADANARGLACVAADPRYALLPEVLHEESMKEIAVSTEKLSTLRERFDWSYYGSLEAHRANREASLVRFSEHYRREQGRGTYVSASLPSLPFPDETFSLALCSHFLFLYEEQFPVSFHLEAVKELYRVVRPGGEVRMYPLHSLRWARYPALGELVEALEREGACVRELPSGLPFIPGSTQLFSVKKP